MSRLKLSLIICTHNPRTDYLSRTLEGLKAQDMPFGDWELLLVDNASTVAVKSRFDIRWHPNIVYLHESELGLTPARLCGIRHAQGELLLFVDDDNILEPNYVRDSIRIGEEYSHLGVWGGQQTGEFEVDPPPHILPHLEMLAIRSVSRAKWSNLYSWETTPAGAGMVIRAAIAQVYLKKSVENTLMQGLDRKGNSLASGGDIDMAYTAIDMGFGAGLFPDLQLTHLIGKARLTEEYMLRIRYGITYSGIIVEHLRGIERPVPVQSSVRAVIGKLYHRLTQSPFEYRMMMANRDAIDRARTFIDTLKQVKDG
jgi:glycosyltransferase involved in cell wall biosynthesis